MDNLPVGIIEAQAKKAMSSTVKERYENLGENAGIKTNSVPPKEYNSKNGETTPGGK